MPRKKADTTYLTVDVPPDVYELIRRAAALKGVSIMKFVRCILSAVVLEAYPPPLPAAPPRDCVAPDTPPLVTAADLFGEDS